MDLRFNKPSPHRRNSIYNYVQVCALITPGCHIRYFLTVSNQHEKSRWSPALSCRGLFLKQWTYMVHHQDSVQSKNSVIIFFVYSQIKLYENKWKEKRKRVSYRVSKTTDTNSHKRIGTIMIDLAILSTVTMVKLPHFL